MRILHFVFDAYLFVGAIHGVSHPCNQPNKQDMGAQEEGSVKCFMREHHS